ncbi:hypothetical protein LSAT2_018557, partial [Lamellibrachia satsuma]
ARSPSRRVAGASTVNHSACGCCRVDGADKLVKTSCDSSTPRRGGLSTTRPRTIRRHNGPSDGDTKRPGHLSSPRSAQAVLFVVSAGFWGDATVHCKLIWRPVLTHLREARGDSGVQN